MSSPLLLLQLENLLTMVGNAEQTFDHNDYDNSAKVWNGMDMAVRLREAGVGPDNLKQIIVRPQALSYMENYRQLVYEAWFLANKIVPSIGYRYYFNCR